MKHIIIIGGGASGIVAAIFSKNKNTKVTVIERNNTCLKKLLMTGNGKCNYLNESYSLNNYHSEDLKIVDKIISSNNLELVRKFFDNLGIVPKVKNGYYYPFSNQATTIKNALLMEAERLGVNFLYETTVTKLEKKSNLFMVTTSNGTFESDKLILSSGSLSYPKTGSDGMGYEFLKSFGHTIISPVPALVQLETSFKYIKELSGIRTDAILNLYEDDKLISTEEGELQLTDYGLSGICTFNISNIASRGLYNSHKETIKVSFLPFIKDLFTPWLDTYFKKFPNKSVKESLEGMLNHKLVKVILKTNAIAEDKKYLELTKAEKYSLFKSLRSFEFSITKAKSYDNAQICNGGLKLTEINEATFESKLVKDLYITGELLDINGNCGGYNLTNCWISGMLAGTSAGEINDKN